jgi:phasin family protein
VARTVTNEAALVGEQTARAGADLARRGADTARDSLQSGVNMATQTFQRINDQFTKALGFNGPEAEERARRSSQNLQAVSQASSVLVKGAQDVSHEWFGFAQERVQKNMDGLNRLLGCRSVQDFVATQSDLARDNLQQVIDINKRVAEVSVRVAEEAARSIQQAQGSPNQARRAA